mgnify:FL=1
MPQPALRGIKNCPEVAKILVDAWSAQNNVIARAVQLDEPKSIDAKNAYTEVETA